MKRLSLVIAFAMAAACSSVETTRTAEWSELPQASWTAWFDSPGGKLECAMSVWNIDGDLEVDFVNGSQHLEFHRCQWNRQRRELEVPIPEHDARIVCSASTDGQRLDGEWSRSDPSGRRVRLSFHATYRGYVRQGCGLPPMLLPTPDARWSARFGSAAEPRLLTIGGGFAEPRCATLALGPERSTVLQEHVYENSDRGSFSGFDGAHAVLLTARPKSDGMLAGELWVDDAVHESWTAMADRDGPASLLPSPELPVDVQNLRHD